MKPVGFWETFFSDSMGHAERERLNEAASELHMLNAQAELSRDNIGRLFDLDRAQADEIENLRVVVRVLTEALLDAGHLDRTLLDERMKTAFTELELKRNPPPADPSAGGPYRGGEGEPAPEPMTTCEKCREQVLARRTTITGQGVFCDVCYAELGG